MRFKTIAFALIVSSAVFILGCDDEDSSTIGGGGRIYFEATVSPPMDSATFSFGSGILTYFSVNNGGTFQLIGGTYTTDEMSVTKGQNLPCIVGLSTPFSTAGSNAPCSNVQIKTYLNGSVFDDRTYNMGGNSTTNPCPDGTGQTYNLIIP